MAIKTGSFPFWSLQQGSQYSIDVHVAGPPEFTKPMYQVFADGVHQPVLDMEAACGIGNGEVQFENMPGTEYMIPPQQLFPYAPMAMSSENGCQPHFFAFHEETITWHFLVKPLKVTGSNCIRCELDAIEKGSNIMIVDGKIVVTIKGAQPYKQQFPGTTIVADEEVQIAISYIKADKVIELYKSGERVEILYYNIAPDFTAQSGQLGCWDTNFHKLEGTITAFFSHAPNVPPPPMGTTTGQHKDRPNFAPCSTYPCEMFNDISILPHGLFLKNKADSAHLRCDTPVCLDRHRMFCCDVLPMCTGGRPTEGQPGLPENYQRKADTPFICQAESEYKFEADKIPCADPTCDESGKSQCCNPHGRCSSMACPEGEPNPMMHRDNPDDRRCEVDPANVSKVDCTYHTNIDICCQPDKRCKTMDCGNGYVHRPNALNLVCSGKEKCDGQGDKDQCCAPKGTCLAMKCPVNHNHKPNPAGRVCADPDCHESNWEVCCAQIGRAHV